MKKLKFADGLDLPIEVVTKKLAFLGITGSGKTYAAQKLAELMLEAKAQIIVLDTVGNWYGLRVAGKGQGFDIPVFGGLKGDIPLDPHAGKILADLVTKRGISAVLDISQMMPNEQARFATDFADQFFQNKKAKPSPTHVFVEECQEIVPQNPMKGGLEPKMLHAFQRLWKLGRNFGIGGSLISQRPQEVSKKVLNQTELLFAFQMNGPQERKAIKSWIADKDITEDIDTLLPKLRNGVARAWSPSWLRLSKNISAHTKRSADASSTPSFGKAVRAKPLTKVDLEAVKIAMAEVIERNKHEDPKELKKELAAVKKELAVASRIRAPAQTKSFLQPKRVEVPVLTKEESAAVKAIELRLKRTEEAVEEFKGELAATAVGLHNLVSRLKRLVTDAPKAPVVSPSFAKPVERATPPKQVVKSVAQAARRTPVVQTEGTEKLAGGERKILIALAQYPEGRTKSQIGILAGYAPKGGGFNNYLGALSSRGLIEGRGIRTITPEGLAALGSFTPLPVGDELFRYWLTQLGKAEREILTVLVEAYPQSLNKTQVAELTLSKYDPTGGGYNNALGRLKKLELIEGRGMLTASAALFG